MSFFGSQWTVTEQACSMFSMATCALYDTLGPDVCGFIINESKKYKIWADRRRYTYTSPIHIQQNRP